MHGIEGIGEELEPGEYFVHIKMLWNNEKKYNSAVLAVYCPEYVKIEELDAKKGTTLSHIHRPGPSEKPLLFPRLRNRTHRHGRQHRYLPYRHHEIPIRLHRLDRRPLVNLYCRIRIFARTNVRCEDGYRTPFGE